MILRNRFSAKIVLIAIFGLCCQAGIAAALDEGGRNDRPVKVVADPLITIQGGTGAGILPGYVSRDWSVPQPEVTRAVLVFHGQLRNADVYWRSAQTAVAASGDARHTIVIVPQFLADADIVAHTLPETYLHWGWITWQGGDNANGPIPLSSYEALDAILVKLADRTLFPNLKTVVLAGHSGGAQVVQHYAVVGKSEALLSQAGVHIRYVVANPSTYLYFSEDRPVAAVSSCPNFDQWKYGWVDAPVYAQAMSREAYEAAYVTLDVVYLLGTKDTNPNHPALDKKCPAEMQGSQRHERGFAYFAYLQKRHPTMTAQRIIEVEGVGHDGDAMFTSPSGLSVLFGQ